MKLVKSKTFLYGYPCISHIGLEKQTLELCYVFVNMLLETVQKVSLVYNYGTAQSLVIFLNIFRES